MKLRKILPGLFAAAGMAVLILDSRTALIGASEGVELCLKTVVPSLFPFFILSGILVGSLMGQEFSGLSPIGHTLGIPKGAEVLLVSGFLGGYPVGAKAVRDAWEEGCVQKEAAERMLSFCNNAGPAFLFGIAGHMFSSPAAAWVIWGIHIISALVTGWLFRLESSVLTHSLVRKSSSITQAMTNAINSCAQVCGWVISFRMLCCFLQRWILWVLPLWMQTAVTGLLELANGCLALGNIASEPVRFVLCSGMLSLGGFSVLMQTMSVTRGLKLNYYIRGKLLQTLISILLSFVYVKWLSPMWLFTVVLLILLNKIRFGGSIPEKYAV